MATRKDKASTGTAPMSVPALRLDALLATTVPVVTNIVPVPTDDTGTSKRLPLPAPAMDENMMERPESSLNVETGEVISAHSEYVKAKRSPVLDLAPLIQKTVDDIVTGRTVPEVELGGMSLPVAIGLVTYSDDHVRAFGLVRQWSRGVSSRKLLKDDIARQIPEVSAPK